MDPGWALVVPAYVLGTFPTAALVGRRRGLDPTVAGSGNPGASNAYRTMGRGAGALVLAGDVAKGAVAAGAGWVVGGRAAGVACAVAVVLGHVAPLTRPGRGGKGVATAAGAVVVLLPGVAAALAALWVVVARLTRTASLASLAVAAGLPAAAALVARPAGEVLALGACAALVVWRHRGNIGRLARGEEARLVAPPGDRPSTGPPAR